MNFSASTKKPVISVFGDSYRRDCHLAQSHRHHDKPSPKTFPLYYLSLTLWALTMVSKIQKQENINLSAKKCISVSCAAQYFFHLIYEAYFNRWLQHMFRTALQNTHYLTTSSFIEMTKEFSFESGRTLTFGCCIRIITFRGVAVVFMWNLIIKKNLENFATDIVKPQNHKVGGKFLIKQC